MDAQSAITRLEGALEQQLMLVDSDSAMEEAGRAMLAVLEPAIRELTVELAGAAAAEVQAQLPDYRVEVVMEEGEPRLSIRPADTEEKFGPSDYEARVTVRLPDQLKEMIEHAAGDSGDSVNTWIVKTLSSKTRRSRGTKVSGTYEI